MPQMVEDSNSVKWSKKAARCVLERKEPLVTVNCRITETRPLVGDVSAKHSDVAAREQRGVDAVAKSRKSEGMRGGS